MDYVILQADTRIKKRIKIRTNPIKKGYRLAEKENIEELPEPMVLRLEEYNANIWTDMIEYSYLLVSEKLYRVLSMYEPELKNTPIFLYQEKTKEKGLGRIILPESISCYSMKPLKIEKEKLKGKQIVRTRGTLENKLIISLAIAESILRREFYGLFFEKIEEIE